ncbi:hypothetical protein M378DRAFT_172627, partial [Amanita muscaria Koide BX008]
MDDMVKLSINMSPDAYPTPKMAQISPGQTSYLNSVSLLCLRTSLGTLTFLPLRALRMIAPFLSYTRISPFLPFEGNSKDTPQGKGEPVEIL